MKENKREEIKKKKGKKNLFLIYLKKKKGKNISRNFSGAVAVSVGLVQFQIAPRSSLHFSTSTGPF